VRYEIGGDPLGMYHCHCSQCRRASGASFATNMVVRSQDLEIVAGSDVLASFESSPGKRRRFCSRCGSPILSQTQSLPQLVSVRCGTLDGDPGVRPGAHLYAGSKAPWTEICDGIPQRDAGLAPSAGGAEAEPMHAGDGGFAVRAIGRVRSPVREAVDSDWGAVESQIVLEPAWRPGLRGLEAFSHVLVVTFLHQASFQPQRHLVRRPRGLASMPELGIFAQRAKDRPNPLGISVVELLRVEPEGLAVRGLDAIDGTPVLDLKPYFPQFDAARGARVPDWVGELMRGYFEAG
jgi:tRNA-Thr(GGU) m(6)t(6)A37 methyltransferase TsaA